MISIIIPFYNVKFYILDCLKSFEKQKYKNFEILMINDGSTDDSQKIVENYIKSSEIEIRLINQENLGVSAARNKGIQNAYGDYLCFVDSDDMVTAEYLSKMISCINQTNCELVICEVEIIEENSDFKLSFHDKESPLILINSLEALEKFLYRDISPGVWALMVKSEIVRNNNLSFSVGYRYSEDIEFVYKILAYAKNIVCIKDKLYLYRIRNTSAMSLVDEKRMEGLKLMEGLKSFFEEVNPKFSLLFNKYGVARWVWATLWQSALVSETYQVFVIKYKMFNARYYIRKLTFFPRLRISITSGLFLISPHLYFFFVKRIKKRKLNGRTFTAIKENG